MTSSRHKPIVRVYIAEWSHEGHPRTPSLMVRRGRYFVPIPLHIAYKIVHAMHDAIEEYERKVQA